MDVGGRRSQGRPSIRSLPGHYPSSKNDEIIRKPSWLNSLGDRGVEVQILSPRPKFLTGAVAGPDRLAREGAPAAGRRRLRSSTKSAAATPSVTRRVFRRTRRLDARFTAMNPAIRTKPSFLRRSESMAARPKMTCEPSYSLSAPRRKGRSGRHRNMSHPSWCSPEWNTRRCRSRSCTTGCARRCAGPGRGWCWKCLGVIPPRRSYSRMAPRRRGRRARRDGRISSSTLAKELDSVPDGILRAVSSRQAHPFRRMLSRFGEGAVHDR